MKKQGLRGFKPPINQFGIIGLSKYDTLRRLYQKETSLNESRFSVLMILITQYLTDGTGLTVYATAARINPNNYGKGSATNIQYKINRLLISGHIEIVGHGRYGSHVYIPTQRVLKELQAMCDKINEL